MPCVGSSVDWIWLRKNISELGDVSIETFQTGKRERKKRNRISINCGTIIKGVAYMKWE